MLSGDIRQYFVSDPWLAIVPGVALTLIILSASLLADATRDTRPSPAPPLAFRAACTSEKSWAEYPYS
jgi:hypothetical protein